MHKPLVLLAGTVALAVGVSACGGSGGASSSASHSATATAVTSAQPSAAAATGGAAASKLTISAAMSGALQFSATSLRAKAGKVTITFVNHSPEGHNLTIVHGSNGAKVGATPTFSGGAKTLTVSLQAGTYTYFCSVPGHRQAGMQGTLTVS